jgi:putative phosphoesterase
LSGVSDAGAMKIGLLSDVHGNLDALEGVLETLSARGIRSVYCLGDVVGYLPAAGQCLHALDRAGAVHQKGNHESMLLSPETVAASQEEVYRLELARRALDGSTLSRIGQWPESRIVEAGGRRLLLVHGSPTEPLSGRLYPDTDLGDVAESAYDAIVCAHTHRPFIRLADATPVVNVGSVGLPRDVGRLASLSVYDVDANTFEIWRIAFDVDAVIARWGEELHEETRACLRRDEGPFVGCVIE